MRLRRTRRRAEPDEDPKLQQAERHVADLAERAGRVERVLSPRHSRNHWAETVERIYEGRAAT